MIEWIKNRIYGSPHPNPNTGDFLVSGQWCGKEIKYKCGHRGYTHFQLLAFGEAIWDNLKHNGVLQTEICGECWLHHLKTKVIQCCLCGQPIIPGHHIIIYRGKVKVKKGVKVTTVPEKEEGKIGCCSYKCSSVAVMVTTHRWDGEKAVPIFESELTAPAEALRTGQPVVVGVRN